MRSFREAKLEIIVLTGAIALLFGVLALFKGMNQTSHIETNDIVYEMPRPTNSDMESEFQLGDRDIIREHIRSERKVTGKKDENKRIAKAPDKNNRPQGKKKKAQKKTAKKKPSVSVRVVEGPEKTAWADDHEPTPHQGGALAYGANPKSPNTAQPEEEKKPQMSYEDWRNLLMSSPTRENMTKVLAAVRENEIEYKDFYRLLQELLTRPEKEVQSVALYGIQAVPHLLSFAMVAKNLDQLTEENRQTGAQILLSYTQANRLPILAQALQVNDFVVVKRAAEAINLGLEKAKSGQMVVDPRLARRGAVVSPTNPTEAFSRFVPIFESWRQSGDSNLVGLADSFLSRWQG